MKKRFSKILFIIVTVGFFSSCNTVKRIPENEQLLTENTIHVNGKKEKSEAINNLLQQRPNKTFLGTPLRLHIHNLARPNIDSILKEKYKKHEKRKARLQKFLSKKQFNRYINSRLKFNNWLTKTGEAPVIINPAKTKKSLSKLYDYYQNNGWFDVDTSYTVTTSGYKKAKIDYHINTGDPYMIDSLSTKISSPVIDSIYQSSLKQKSLIKVGDQYKSSNFIQDRENITTDLRNNGIYHFGSEYVKYEIVRRNDTTNLDVEIQILDRTVRKQDSIYSTPFKKYTIKDVNIFTDSSFENRFKTSNDSIQYNGYNLHSIGKMRYKPKAITDAIFITPDKIFRDIDRTYSYRYISELRTFKYPNIDYIENPDTTLTANIYLTPLKKFNLGFSAEVSQSNIQSIGFSVNPSIKARNVFRGAETLELSAIASIGASKDAANDNDQFFDINEIGLDLKLTIPRLFSPFNTEKIIPKRMSPSTRIGLSATSQTNIGLDKQTLTGIFNYKWFPSNSTTNRLDLFNIQYVRNLNPDNYFGVYKNSYNTLNDIALNINYNNGEDLLFPNQTDLFIDDVLNGNTSITETDSDYTTVSSINERKRRLTEDNLIFSSNFNYIKDKRTSPSDKDFSIFRVKLELAGNLLSNASKLLGFNKNTNDQYEMFNVAYSQYAKTELDYIKHWDLGKKNVLAIRSFFGIALPYGNSDNIPFSKSFFGGGANDNRAWTAYNLGPGTSDSANEFNEANFKLAFSVEQRFNLFGDLDGALFVDAGNIWNIADSEDDPNKTFTSLKNLKDLAIGSGFGLRYDFRFFVFRFDVGLKTYEPSYKNQDRWFNNYNFGNAVYNIGINYPF